jgi:lipid A 3-O-deacylase
MPSFRFCFLPAVLFFTAILPATAQSSSSQAAAPANASPTAASSVQELLSHHPWNWGAFFNGGLSAGVSPSSTYLSVGARAGKVLSDVSGPGILRGQFEFSSEIMPWWQGRTATFNRYNLSATSNPDVAKATGPYKTGGDYNGISITPIILRWDLATGSRRFLPFVQGAGGLIWTNHKYPPVGPFPAVGHQGTSVFNFTPQFGVGFQYFIKPKRSITFNANAVHISNASLGDANPGVNATVQFQIGYSWWK